MVGVPTLFLVSTPIGNLEDMTFRAIRVLREVALIAAEDTRRTAKLLSHFDIHTATTSFYEQVEHEKTPRLLARLAAGESIALVSDAGTPGISDPGYRLAKAAIAAGVRVEAVPGASSVLTALVSSGLPTDEFSFLGFPPPKAQARDRWLAELASRKETLVLFEAQHRLRETLTAVARIFGERPIALARELTKIHEELVRGTTISVLTALPEPRGEFTIVLAGAGEATAPPEPMPSGSDLLSVFCQLTEREGMSRRDAVNALSSRYGLASKVVYKAIEDAKSSVE
jgi:16S rRNA (cytidine1402-2'-O)-methyltransferase